jgi:hypothetical protein
MSTGCLLVRERVRRPSQFRERYSAFKYSSERIVNVRVLPVYVRLTEAPAKGLAVLRVELAHESTRQHVQPGINKGIPRDRPPWSVAYSRERSPSERDLVVGHVADSVIGDDSAVRVASQAVKHIFWSSRGPLGVNHPVMAKQRSQERVEGFLVGTASHKREPTGAARASKLPR